MRSLTLLLFASFALLGAAEARTPEAPHYQIRLELDPAHDAIAADVRVRLPASGPAEQRFLLGSTYAVSRAETGRNARVQVTPGEHPQQPMMIVVHRTAPGPIQLHLSYAGALSPTNGLNTVSPERLELSADSLWYPISTNFNARVTVDLRARGAPRDLVVVSPDRVRQGLDRFTIRRTHPNADIAFSGAPGLQRAANGPLHFYARDLTTPQAQAYQEFGPRAVAFYENWLGPLPGDRVVISITQRSNGVGYSRRGYVIVSDPGIAFAAENVWPREGYIAHEISHNYWSSANFTSEDYWLVESTAEYSALRFIESVEGVAARQTLLDGKQQRAARGGAILGGGRPSDDAVYARGPLLLFALEERVGRTHLDRILRDLAQREAITTTDFLARLAQEASVEDAAWFEARLREP